ncbi:MAG: pyridoxamine 5'-phosphate oxidase family protein [Candidatus Cloacimonetes bacterium]|nr:pyridoxamine 5'-phosphate oxidase family protein [Candidatus Cloacimonadota bacterium]
MRELRRKDRAIADLDAINILTAGDFGVLSTVDEDAQPYGVPLNYVYLDGSIYFHAAYAGHKIDNIAGNPQVSFCVVGKNEVIAEQFTTRYESVICYGKAGIVENEEKINALVGLLEKYTPDHLEAGKKSIMETLSRVAIIKITIEHFSGKAHR